MSQAFLLRTVSGTTFRDVKLTSAIDFVRLGGAGFTGNWSLKFKIQINGTNLPIFAGETVTGNADSTNLVFFTSATVIQIRTGNSQRNVTLQKSAVTNLCEYELVGSSATNNITVFQDGVPCGTVAGSHLFTTGLRVIFALLNAAQRHGDFYWAEFYNNGVLQHRYDPSASNGAGLILVDTQSANNGTLDGPWPTNSSQWVPYDDGSASNEQILSASGTLASVQTGSAVTAAINEQALSASGTVQAAQFGAANVTAVNEQVFSLTGQLTAYTAGAADTVAINAQHQPLTGSLQLQSDASATLSAVNVQHLSATGFTTAYSSGIAVLTAINDQAGEQTGSISGQLRAVTLGIASVQGVNDQHLQLTGTASAISQGAGYITPINEQQFSLAGETHAYSAGVAVLQAINEQAGEQIGFIIGQLIAIQYALTSLQSVNDQQGNISGTTTTASSGRAMLQKINKGNIELAPDRMTAQRIMPTLVATRTTPKITGTRLTNNITAQRV